MNKNVCNQFKEPQKQTHVISGNFCLLFEPDQAQGRSQLASAEHRAHTLSLVVTCMPGLSGGEVVNYSLSKMKVYFISLENGAHGAKCKFAKIIFSLSFY
jgi:hypothetical protein